MKEHIKYYVITISKKGEPCLHIGPFTGEDHHTFAAGLWFGKTVLLPYATRKRRVPFDKDKENIYYSYVNTNNGRMAPLRNVTVGDLGKGMAVLGI